MSVIKDFTRREVIDLTKTTSNRLQYLERTGLVVPSRVEKSKKPTVLYTWEQMLEIRAIKNLRKEVSLQTVRKIIQFLDDRGFDNSLRDRQMVVVDDDVFWVRTDWTDFHKQMPSALKVASKKSKGIAQYTLIVIPQLIEIVDEIWQNAQESEVVDFEEFKQRAKAKSTKVA